MNKKSKPDEVKDKSAKNSKAEKTTDKPEEKATEKKKEPTLEEQLADAKDQLLRTAAEFANYRTRVAKEKEQTYVSAKGTVIAEILPSIDNLERALAQDGADYDSLKKGVEMTLSSLMSALEKLGVESFGESGDEFDPNCHNAVMHVEDNNYGENVVTDVFQKGYRINNKVIRTAMVKTAN